jgi:DNA repair protein RecO (recombination protein O)
MPAIRDDALVIGLSPTGEADLVVRLLCREHGRRSAFARSARSSRKRFAGALQPFTHIQAEMSIRRTQRLTRLESADIVDAFMPIRENLTKIYLASYYCDLLASMLVEGESYPGFFEMSLFFLHRLTQTDATLKHRLFFEIRLLDALGYRPEARTCAESGESIGGGGFFDPQRQSFLCAHAGRLAREAFPVSEEARLVLEDASAIQLAQLGEIRLSPKAASELLKVTHSVLSATLDRPLQSAALLDKELGT